MNTKDNTTKPELLPCPFCGCDKPELSVPAATPDMICVRCPDCWAKSLYVLGILSGPVDAVEAWNRRA